MNAERPLGISILSVLLWIGGILTVLLGLTAMFAGIAIAFADPSGAGAGLAISALALPAIGLGVAYCAVGGGLWRLSSWAWWVVVVGRVLSAVTALIFLAAVPVLALLVGIPIVLSIDVLILIYLLTPRVREAFRVGVARRPVRLSSSAGQRCPNPGCRLQLDSRWRYCPYCLASLAESARPSSRGQDSQRCANPSCGIKLRRGWRNCPYCLAVAVAVAR